MSNKNVDLKKYRGVGDEDADTFAASIWPNGVQDQSALMRGIGRWDPRTSVDKAPPVLVPYLTRPLDLPDWADLDRLRRAQRAYDSRKLRARTVLATYSLPILYLHAETSLTLSLTGQLVMHVRRRLLDTMAFTEAVMAPGCFDNGGKGALWVRKIRLTHALVRLRIKSPSQTHRLMMLNNSSKEEVATWLSRLPLPDQLLQMQAAGSVVDAMPLDQVELAFVLQTFAYAVVEGLDQLGKPMSADEPADYILAWSIIGHWLGIVDDLLPASGSTAPDAKGLFEQIRDGLMAGGDPLGPDEKDPKDPRLAGPLLCSALITTLVQVQRERIPQQFRKSILANAWLDEALQQMPRVLMRKLCGVRAVRQLRVGRAPLLHWLICRIALLVIDIDQVADYPMPQPKEGVILSGAQIW